MDEDAERRALLDEDARLAPFLELLERSSVGGPEASPWHAAHRSTP